MIMNQSLTKKCYLDKWSYLYFHVLGSSSNLSLMLFAIRNMKAVRPAPVPRIDPTQ